MERLRVALVRAGEALEDGDLIYAQAIISTAIEVDGPSERPHRCGECGAAYLHPGLLSTHRFRAGHELGAELPRAAAA